MNSRESNPKQLPESALDENTIDADPLVLFARWLSDADACHLSEPAAMTLATATADGVPSARIVLLRGFDERGFVFYTNYQSRKAAELAVNHHAALVFYWDGLRRQVRVEGTVALVSAEESDRYFRARPVGHQLSALASPQSQVIADRAFLEKRMAELQEQYQDGEVPRPAHWGGYRVIPHLIEFWQGRDSRLHDRIRYRRAQAAWVVERLAP